MIELRVANGSRITGELLRKMLTDKGVEMGTPAAGVVCYGVGYNGQLPCLNGAAGRQNKYEELQILRAGGVTVPRTWLAAQYLQVQRPCIARRFNHKGGTDIWKLQTLAGVAKWAQKRDFFTEFIPNDREFRVWIYRENHLGTYEKVLRHPEQKRSVVCRNHRHGYAFELVEAAGIPRAAVELAKRAVGALGLDFAAIDLLHGRNGNYYVLEANTAPGVEGEARQGIQLLAGHLATWTKKMPTRREAAANGQ